MTVFIQFIGTEVLFASILKFAVKNRTNFIIVSMLINVLLCIQYFLLSSFSGGFLCLVGIFRCIIYLYKGRYKFLSRLYVPIFFVVCNIIVSVLTYTIWFDIFPAVVLSMNAFIPWLKDVKVMKMLTLSYYPCWFIYDFCVCAWISLLKDSIVFCISFIWLICENEQKYQ